MPRYLPDTNVLIDFGRDPAARARLENAQNIGCEFVIGPPALTELVRGLVASGNEHFQNDKRVFEWLLAQGSEVLPLPRPFMASILKTTAHRSVNVTPQNYVQLMEMIAASATFEEFLGRSEAPTSAWKQIIDADRIHNEVLDREFEGLSKLAKRRGYSELAKNLSQSFGVPGHRPIPLILERRFSAGLEFLQASLRKVERGAKPRKNDPGLYVDFQLLLYLADPEITLLTKEDFSGEIRASSQATRIVDPSSLWP